MHDRPAPHLDPERRQDFVVFFDVRNGNPNGDPDADNRPRMMPSTGTGLVTDVCIKRKVRNWVDMTAERVDPDDSGDGANLDLIHVRAGSSLNSHHAEAYEALGHKANDSKGKGAPAVIEDARVWMCARYWDVRTFGAVMSTGNHSAGQVQGPVQVGFAESVDPIEPMEHLITRVARTTDEDAADSPTQMGRRWTVPYGLYRATGSFTPPLARRTGSDSEDLATLWTALVNMFSLDRSASRGEMATRALWVFSHRSGLGEAPAHRLTDQVSAARVDAATGPATGFGDYEITGPGVLPDGVVACELAG